MCITEVKAWRHGEALFATEIDAIEAALSDLGQKLMKDHHARLDAGLLANSEALVRLLTRHGEINAALPSVDPDKELEYVGLRYGTLGAPPLAGPPPGERT